MRNHKKAVISGLIVLAVIIIGVPAFALTYAGVIPGVTALFNINKPVDLGVTYTAADYKAFQTKTLSDVEDYDGGSLTKAQPKLAVYGADSIETTVTQSELTAFLNMVPWADSPLSNAQIRLDGNGVFEFSGNVNANYLSDLINTIYPGGNYNSWWQSMVIGMASHLDNPAVYFKAAIASVDTTEGPDGGELHFKPLAIKVNHIDLSSYVNNMNELVSQTHAARGSGLEYSVSSLKVKAGALEYYGNFPASFAVGSGDIGSICQNYHGGSVLLLSPLNGQIGSVSKYCP